MTTKTPKFFVINLGKISSSKLLEIQAVMIERVEKEKGREREWERKSEKESSMLSDYKELVGDTFAWQSDKWLSLTRFWIRCDSN